MHERGARGTDKQEACTFIVDTYDGGRSGAWGINDGQNFGADGVSPILGPFFAVPEINLMRETVRRRGEGRERREGRLGGWERGGWERRGKGRG